MIRILAVLCALVCASPALAQVKLPAGLDPQNTILLDTKNGRVIIKLRNDIAPLHAERIKQLVREGYKFLTQALERLHIRYVPSATNFILMELGPRASSIAQALLRRGIIVREMSAWKLPGCIRVTLGTMPEKPEDILKRVANDPQSPDFNSNQLEGKYYFAATADDVGPAFDALQNQIIRLSK